MQQKPYKTFFEINLLSLKIFSAEIDTLPTNVTGKIICHTLNMISDISILDLD